MLIVRGLIGGLTQVALFSALLLIPAGLIPGGTWTWDRGLMFLGAYGATLVVSVVTLGLAAPASLEARLQGPTSKAQPAADRWVTAILILAFFVWFVFLPIDEDQTEQGQTWSIPGCTVWFATPCTWAWCRFSEGLRCGWGAMRG